MIPHKYDSGLIYFKESLHSFLDKVQTKIVRICKNSALEIHDWFLTSYSFNVPSENSMNLTLADQSSKVIFNNEDWLIEVTNHFLSHRFDLLGSGWTKNFYGMQCRGLEEIRFKPAHTPLPDAKGTWLNTFINQSNIKESTRIWTLLNHPYEPIDWQLDFKSGYRWDQKKWFTKILIGQKAGADIKLPWELARMQHLPLFAKAYSFAQKKTDGFSDPENYIREFRNQILDFIATNPPRWGVNWSSTMDVSIRIINWLIAYDLFSTFGATFDAPFKDVFFRSVYEHGLHIANHLEWHPKYRNNHYLSNIVGLLFVAAYFRSNKKSDSWLNFSIQELINEVDFQFNKDGSNFEASTCYHRLSAELVLYATVLVLGLPAKKHQALKESANINLRPHILTKKNTLVYFPLPNSKEESPFPAWYFERLEKMAEFTLSISKPDGHVPQIGDNDSGRLFKLFPIYKYLTVKIAKEKYQNLRTYSELRDQDIYWMEDFLDHRNLVSAFCGLFNRSDFAQFPSSNEEELFIRSLSHEKVVNLWSNTFAGIKAGKTGKSSNEDWQNCELLLDCYSPSPVITKIHLDKPINRDAMDYVSYPDFGVFICRSKEFYLAIRCGSVGQNGNGGHAHNDQLSIELTIDKNSIITDPGTYLYSPFVNKRNEYRSAFSHFVPHISLTEPADLTRNIFSLEDPKAEVLYFGNKGFVGCHNGYGSKVYRRIVINDFDIIISDYSQKSNLIKTVYTHVPFSPAYGVVQSDDMDLRSFLK